MKRRIKPESGFTLLELLISLALVAVLVTAKNALSEKVESKFADLVAGKN